MEEIFKRLLPEIAQIKQVASEGKTICWEAYDASGAVLGYAFAQDVPESLDFPGAEEMDKYRVFGVVDAKDYKIIKIDIAIHPEGPEEPWTMDITEPEFEKQFTGLTVTEINLSPDGKIDAISEATLSSTWVTNAIREKVEEIIVKTKK